MWGCSKVKAVGVGRNGTTLPGGVSAKVGDIHRLSVSEAGDKDRWQSPEPGFDFGETPWCVLGGARQSWVVKTPGLLLSASTGDFSSFSLSAEVGTLAQH